MRTDAIEELECLAVCYQHKRCREVLGWFSCRFGQVHLVLHIALSLALTLLSTTNLSAVTRHFIHSRRFEMMQTFLRLISLKSSVYYAETFIRLLVACFCHTTSTTSLWDVVASYMHNQPHRGPSSYVYDLSLRWGGKPLVPKADVCCSYAPSRRHDVMLMLLSLFGRWQP